MKIHVYYVYLMTNRYNAVLYTGVTNDLLRRCYEHKSRLIKCFTSRYNIDKLVYFEEFDSINDAIQREKQIKGYTRKKKNSLIEALNSEWKNLFENNRINFSSLKLKDEGKNANPEEK